MMKKLFIYYSLSGNGDLAAEKMKEAGFDIRKATLKKPMPKSFFLRIMKGGFLAGVKNRAKLDGFDPDVSLYDEIVVGSPIWNGRPAPAINTVLEKVDFTGKKVSFVLYSGGGSAPKTVERLNREFPGASVTMLTEPKKNPSELEKLPKAE